MDKFYESEVHGLVQMGDTMTLTEILKGMPSAVDEVDEGDMPLHVACGNGIEQVVLLLLKHGADPNSPTEEEGDTAFHVAVRYEFPGNLRCLLAHASQNWTHRLGECLNATNKDGLTALHLAAECGSVELVKALVMHGANIQALNPADKHACAIATALGNDEVSAWLKGVECRDYVSSAVIKINAAIVEHESNLASDLRAEVLKKQRHLQDLLDCEAAQQMAFEAEEDNARTLAKRMADAGVRIAEARERFRRDQQLEADLRAHHRRILIKVAKAEDRCAMATKLEAGAQQRKVIVMRSLEHAQRRLEQTQETEARVRQRQEMALQSQLHEQKLQSEAVFKLGKAQKKRHKCYAYLADLLQEASKGVLQ